MQTARPCSGRRRETWMSTIPLLPRNNLVHYFQNADASYECWTQNVKPTHHVPACLPKSSVQNQNHLIREDMFCADSKPNVLYYMFVSLNQNSILYTISKKQRLCMNVKTEKARRSIQCLSGTLVQDQKLSPEELCLDCTTSISYLLINTTQLRESVSKP
jgi:hypothetical protein